MTRDAAMLLALTLTFAAWIVVHLGLLVSVTRNRQLSIAWRALGWVPPFTPIVGWRCGAKVASVAWLALGVAYAALKAAA